MFFFKNILIEKIWVFSVVESTFLKKPVRKIFSESEIQLMNTTIERNFLMTTVFRVSDGNGYPFLYAKKIAVNVATPVAAFSGGQGHAQDLRGWKNKFKSGFLKWLELFETPLLPPFFGRKKLGFLFLIEIITFKNIIKCNTVGVIFNSDDELIKIGG